MDYAGNMGLMGINWLGYVAESDQMIITNLSWYIICE